MLHPEPAPPGSVVRIVAPSGPFDALALERGMAELRDYDLRALPGLVGRKLGFLAGSDEERLTELQAALDCHEARVIWLARGGFGLSRIAHRLDWTGFLRRPKWIAGFSDGTVLHQATLARGIASLHGPNVTSLGASADDERNALSLRSTLVGRVPAFSGLRTLTSGSAAGPLVGGNLTMLCMQAAAGQLTLPPGALLMLEDVDETSYRVDRMLTALVVGGHLDQVAAVVLGTFTNCSPGRFDVPVAEVLFGTLGPLGVPMVDGFPSGHGDQRQTWIHGGHAELETNSGTLTQLNPS